MPGQVQNGFGANPMVAAVQPMQGQPSVDAAAEILASQGIDPYGQDFGQASLPVGGPGVSDSALQAQFQAQQEAEAKRVQTIDALTGILQGIDTNTPQGMAAAASVQDALAALTGGLE